VWEQEPTTQLLDGRGTQRLRCPATVCGVVKKRRFISIAGQFVVVRKPSTIRLPEARINIDVPYVTG
jgi:hypothetical protein